MQSSSSIPEYDLQLEDPEWWEIREVVWDRDGLRCQLCGKPSGAIGRKPDVLTANLNSPDKENSVCVCPKCRSEYVEGESAASDALTKPKLETFHGNHPVGCPHEDCSPYQAESWFDTELKMKLHYGNAHGSSLAKRNKTCDNCNESFSYYPSKRAYNLCKKCRIRDKGYKQDTCGECGEAFTVLGQHWAQSECGYPNISGHTSEILTGMLLGDAWVNNRDPDAVSIAWTMSNETFLNYLSEEIGILAAHHPRLNCTSEEAAEKATQSGIVENPDPDDYSELYYAKTRRHPYFKQFTEWYDSDGKRFPLNDITFTPTVLKYWYVCDGDLYTGNVTPYARISSVNEVGRLPKVADAIARDTGIRPEVTDQYHRIRFNTEESRAFFEYVGWDPLPGFEYKWPDKKEYSD